jgi:hypothetical protein
MAPKPRVVDDPNTFIPPAVRKLAQQADAAFRAQPGQPPQEPAPPQPQPTPPFPGEPPHPPPLSPTPPPPSETPAPGTGQLELTFPPVEAGSPAPSSAPAPAPPPAPVEEESWERRYKAMEGRYKRAENDVLSMSAQLASMQNLIASMQRPAPETLPELRPQSLLTPEEVSEYGPEFLGVVARRAKEELTPEVSALRRQLTNLEQQLTSNAEQQAAKARFEMEAGLDRALPQWRDINVMPEFHSWLALPDMYSGAIKHDLLRTAYAQSNTPRVLSFFKGFLDQEAVHVPPSQQPQPPASNGNGKLSLEDFAAPGRAKTSAASVAPVEKPIITRAQISQFYADSASGKYRGREAEKNQLEAMIFEAEREGRIR